LGKIAPVRGHCERGLVICSTRPPIGANSYKKLEKAGPTCPALLAQLVQLQAPAPAWKSKQDWQELQPLRETEQCAILIFAVFNFNF
jgi:hypothetical protein